MPIDFRNLPEDAANYLEQLARKLIASVPAAVGCVLFGYDSNVIATYDLSEELDPQTIGDVSLGICRKSQGLANEFFGGKLQQFWAETDKGSIHIFDVGSFLVIVLSDSTLPYLILWDESWTEEAIMKASEHN